jgi:adenylate cyclase
MSEKEAIRHDAGQMWKWYLTGEKPDLLSRKFELQLKFERSLMGLLPHKPRCVVCYSPFSGVGGLAMKVVGRRKSSYSPRLCNSCEVSVRKYESGAEVELTMLFADIRGSTELAERLDPVEFHEVIQRFYRAASDVLIERNAMINRLMGDQVIGLFVPRFAGADHPRVSIGAALELLRVTGHQDQGGPWIPVGVGVHTGVAYVGAVGAGQGVGEIAVLGNEANLTARLSSSAAGGEVLVSEACARAAGIEGVGGEKKQIQLKGISEPVFVRSLRIESVQ